MRRHLSTPFFVVVGVGVALVIIGVTAYIAGGAADAGWFATVAQNEADLTLEGVTLVRPVQWWGLLIGGVGALLLSGAGGYAFGRSRRGGTPSDR